MAMRIISVTLLAPGASLIRRRLPSVRAWRKAQAVLPTIPCSGPANVVRASEGSGDKEPLAKQLGAHHYIDSKAGDPAAAFQSLGGAKVILATASDSKSMSELIGGLCPRGRMIVAGAGSAPIEVSPLL